MPTPTPTPTPTDQSPVLPKQVKVYYPARQCDATHADAKIPNYYVKTVTLSEAGLCGVFASSPLSSSSSSGPAGGGGGGGAAFAGADRPGAPAPKPVGNQGTKVFHNTASALYQGGEGPTNQKELD